MPLHRGRLCGNSRDSTRTLVFDLESICCIGPADGCIRRQFFVSHGLAGELVRAQEIEGMAVISFRNMYIRETNTKAGISRPIILPMTEN